ncbi:hypothetical protein Dimus_013187 [Dionaea muscipula]
MATTIITPISNFFFSLIFPSKSPPPHPQIAPPLSSSSPSPQFLSIASAAAAARSINATEEKRRKKGNGLFTRDDDGYDGSLQQQLPSDVMSVVCPSMAYANTLYFKSGYNVQVLVDENEPEELLLSRFRREVMSAGIIQECKRRRFYENPQDKRKSRDAAKRNARRRRPEGSWMEGKSRSWSDQKRRG